MHFNSTGTQLYVAQDASVTYVTQTIKFDLNLRNCAYETVERLSSVSTLVGQLGMHYKHLTYSRRIVHIL